MGLVGCSSVLYDLYRRIEELAGRDRLVVIQGETGTGKELLVRLLHARSSAAEGPLVMGPPADLPPAPYRAQLEALAQEARGGTLHLGELSEFTVAGQGELADFLGRFRGHPRLAATLQELPGDREPAAGLTSVLRAVVAATGERVRVPSLRERLDDLPLLVRFFLRRHGRDHGKVVPPPSPRLLADLARHPWYGNVRELKNELEQAVLFAPAGEPLVLERFSPDFLAGLGATPPPVPPAAALVSG